MSSSFVAGTLVHSDNGLVPIKNFYDFYLSRPNDKLASTECYEIELTENKNFFVGEKGMLVKNSNIQGKTE